jgi:hypothetical protein
MADFWGELVADGEVDAVPALPSLDGMDLLLPSEPDVIADFLERLENLALDLIADAAIYRRGPTEAIAGSMRRPVATLAAKIRRASAGL